MPRDAGPSQETAGKGFDYERFLAALQIFAAPEHPLPGPEVRLQRWRYDPLPAYNGFSGDERVFMWQRQKWARKAGLYPAPEACAVCGIRTNLNFHSENYADLWNAIPLCLGCHMSIHRRFTHPAGWARRLALGRGESQEWLKLLPREPIDVAGWLRARNVPSFLWPAPRP
jgi:hypothetical protein